MAEGEQQVMQISAGEQLKHLREQKNLSVQDIATRLNLEVRIIEAIETDSFELLPAATYARGYLRSYAKLLNADVESILAAYNDEAPAPPEIIPEVKHSTQTSSSDKPVKAFTYLISLSLFILLIAWWYSTQLEDAGDTETETISEESLPPPGLSYDIPVIVHSPLPYYSAPEIVEAESIQDTAEASPDDANQEATAEEAGGTDDDYPLVVNSDSEGPDSLVLSLSAESWIEVYEASGNRIHIGVGREGQVISLRGTAPFEVLLGFSEGVKVEFNSEVFDAAPYTKGSIARFTLNN